MDRTEKDRDNVGHGPCLVCGYPRNLPENRFCGRCGTVLERPPARSGELAPRTEEGKPTLRERFLPGGFGPVGRTVAAGLVAVAAEAGLAWLRHRSEAGRPAPLYDADSTRRGEGEAGAELPYGYLFREAVLLIEGERGRRAWYSSELAVRRSRIEGGERRVL